MESPQEDFIKKIRAGGNTPLKIHPRAVTPSQVAVPLLNNTATYGPWVVSNGLEGKVYFEQSSDLVPWNYGGYSNMEQAAYSRINDKVVGLQDAEIGQVEVPGLPSFNLGDSLFGNGPTITSIDLRVDSNSITTVYSMQTYTPRFGAFSRQNSDRLNRINRNSIQNIREIKQTKREKKTRQQILSRASSTVTPYLGKQPESQKFKASNTHTVISGLFHDGEDGKRAAVNSSSSEEAIASMNLDDIEFFKKTAAVDQSFFFRPVSLDPEATFNHFETPESGEKPKLIAKTPTAKDLNPYKDYETAKTSSTLVTWGDSYEGFNILKHEDSFEPEKVRTMALRGPIILTGWGYDLVGNETPDDKKESDKWKTGPVDLRWDDARKVWTCPILTAAETIERIESGKKGKVKLYGKWGGEEGKTIEVTNWFNSDIEAGYKCFIAYVGGIGTAMVNLDCSPSDGSDE